MSFSCSTDSSRTLDCVNSPISSVSLGCDSTADVPCFDGSEDAKDSCTFPLQFALCFPHSYAKVMGLEKKDHTGEVPISSRHIMAIFYNMICNYWCWPRSIVRFYRCERTVPTYFRMNPFGKPHCVHIHLRNKTLCLPPLLRVEYLHSCSCYNSSCFVCMDY